jgi:hypothetical protein
VLDKFLSVVVRVWQVWEQSQRNQVFQVSPYFPLKEMAAAIQNAGFDVRGFPVGGAYCLIIIRPLFVVCEIS